MYFLAILIFRIKRISAYRIFKANNRLAAGRRAEVRGGTLHMDGVSGDLRMLMLVKLVSG